MTVAQTAKASYVVFIVKSCIYGGFVAILLWKHQVGPMAQTFPQQGENTLRSEIAVTFSLFRVLQKSTGKRSN